MLKLKSIVIFLLSIYFNNAFSQSHFVGMHVKDIESGQPLINVLIEAGNGHKVYTNNYGYAAVEIGINKTQIVFSKVGYLTDTLDSKALNDTVVYVFLNSTHPQKAVTVIGKNALSEIKSTRISVNTIRPKDIKYLPSIGGELDVIKVIQLLPGVQRGLQGQSGFQVRGGDADQNLILLDEATVYNVSHLFGFFSVFIPESIEDMQLYKGGFPAEYGGRLSSILDIRMKDGNNKKWSGSGGVGMLSSRITLEGPIIKNKSSFIISARRTYIDQVFKLIGVRLPYYFYDFNIKLNYELNKKNKFFFSTYYGNDVLKFKSDDIAKNDSSNESFNIKFGFKLGNYTNTIRWNHIFSTNLFSNTSLIYTQFKYNVNGEFAGNGIYIGSKIFDLGLKQDFTYFKNKRNIIRFGFNIVNHKFSPNIISAAGDITQLIKNQKPPSINNLETGMFVRNEQNLGKLKINYGLRMSGTFTEKVFYHGLEPRLALAYDVSKFGAIKIGLARMKQYLHLVSSSSVALPTDLWYPVTKNIKPQISNQATIAYHHLFSNLGISASIEAYYKTMGNLTEYKEGAVLILNNNYEKELLQGKGYAYGTEFLIKKEKGKLYGWISYTLGYSNRIFKGLNKGEMFPAKYDRRHNLAIVANYKLSKRWEISSVWNYISGAKFTAQIGQYFQPNPGLNGIDIIPIYTKRNAVSMSPSHRLDLNFIWKGKETAKYRAEWYFGAYNVYNRAEPYTIKVDYSNGAPKYTQPGLFGLIFNISYNFYF